MSNTNGLGEQRKDKRKKTVINAATDSLKIQLRERTNLPRSEPESDDCRLETTKDKAIRLARLSAYANKRRANETREERKLRLSKMTKDAHKRLANETAERRANRLAKMSQYISKRLADESEEQRLTRLQKMREYAIKHRKTKKRRNTAKVSRKTKNPKPEMVLIRM